MRKIKIIISVILIIAMSMALIACGKGKEVVIDDAKSEENYQTRLDLEDTSDKPVGKVVDLDTFLAETTKNSAKLTAVLKKYKLDFGIQDNTKISSSDNITFGMTGKSYDAVTLNGLTMGSRDDESVFYAHIYWKKEIKEKYYISQPWMTIKTHIKDDAYTEDMFIPLADIANAFIGRDEVTAKDLLLITQRNHDSKSALYKTTPETEAYINALSMSDSSSDLTFKIYGDILSIENK